ncbi:MAG: DUF1232 domain-containing protein [Spirochaetaceae bacterium]|nr:DUF1232 domain-containing protein [Spirochaetaceae bacterium]
MSYSIHAIITNRNYTGIKDQLLLGDIRVIFKYNMSKNKSDNTNLDDKGRPLKMANKLGVEATEQDVENVEQKLPKMKKGPVAKIWDKVIDIWEAFKSPNTPVAFKALLIGSLLYLILPFDVVPDIIPGIGLIDDVGVLTLMWTKLNKVVKTANLINGKDNKKEIFNSISDKVQDRIKQAYKKAFEIAQDKLDDVIRAKARITIYNSFVTLGIFVVSYLLVINGSDTSILLGAIGLVYLTIRTTVNIIKNLPIVLRFLIYLRRSKDIDKAISLYLKNKYSFIEPLELMKNKIKILGDVPDLDIIIKMQRKALKKTIITVCVTIVIIIIMVFVLRRYLLLKTSYTTLSLILLPLKKLFYSLGI